MQLKELEETLKGLAGSPRLGLQVTPKGCTARLSWADGSSVMVTRPGLEDAVYQIVRNAKTLEESQPAKYTVEGSNA